MVFPQHNVEGLLNSCPRVGGYLLGWACNRKNCYLFVPLPRRSKVANLFGHGHGRNRGHGRRNRHHRQRRNGRRR